MLNVLFGSFGLILLGALMVVAPHWILAPLLLKIAFLRHLAPVDAFDRFATVVMAGFTILTAALAGGMLASVRRAVTLGQATAASLLSLLALAGIVIGLWGGWAVLMLGQGVVFKLVLFMVFWLPATVSGWFHGRVSHGALIGHTIGVAAVVALSMAHPVPPSVFNVQTLTTDPRLPRFGDGSVIARGLAEGGTLIEVPAKRAARAAVLQAATAVRAAPCDANAVATLRRALLAFANTHIVQWNQPPVETIDMRGRKINAARQLDEAALAVLAQALPAKIVRAEDLSDATKRELALAHFSQANPTGDAVVSLICTQ